MSELDRILRVSDTPPPSAGFADEVMRRVEAEAASPRPLAFPWRVVVGVAVMLIATGLALVGAGEAPSALELLGERGAWILGLALVSGAAAILPLEMFDS